MIIEPISFDDPVSETNDILPGGTAAGRVRRGAGLEVRTTRRESDSIVPESPAAGRGRCKSVSSREISNAAPVACGVWFGRLNRKTRQTILLLDA
jgi:hypothetical protein